MDRVYNRKLQISTTQGYKEFEDNRGMKQKGPPDQRFAARFRELCEGKELPWTQQAVAKFIHKSTATAWNYMNGVKLPSMENAIDLALRFNCCVEWLLTGRGPKRPGGEQLPPEIAQVVEAMTLMEPEQQYQAKQIVDIIAHPPAKPSNPSALPRTGTHS
jgi:DNA-binding XRE family transcriptional regulator